MTVPTVKKQPAYNPEPGVYQIPLDDAVKDFMAKLGVKLGTDANLPGEKYLVCVVDECGCCAQVRIGQDFETVMQSYGQKMADIGAMLSTIGVNPTSEPTKH